METKTHRALTALPPKLQVRTTMTQWSALLLAVSDYGEVAVRDLLYPTSRSGSALLLARKLLVWAFIEVCDVEEVEAVAWLTMTMTCISRRTILQIITDGSPNGLRDVVESYARLVAIMGNDELREAVGAGLFGERGYKSRLWSKGFTENLGLRNM